MQSLNIFTIFFKVPDSCKWMKVDEWRAPVPSVWNFMTDQLTNALAPAPEGGEE